MSANRTSQPSATELPPCGSTSAPARLRDLLGSLFMSIGAHIHAEDVLGGALERKAEVVQFFLGDPQSWKTPQPHPQAEALADAGLRVFVHSPYPVNIASTNNRIRIPSRKTVTQHAEQAAKIGAAGLIVHGGHVTR